jgi:methyltransferase (TIGR00027 family)
MQEGRPSATAITAAMVRAAHLAFDDAPKVFSDSLALRLSGMENVAALQATLDAMIAEVTRLSSAAFAHTLSSHNRAFTVMRSRYTEDTLDEALARGITQYVILGAGLDSFAYRQPPQAQGLRIFEVDHPATQAWKRARLRELQLDPPSNLTFVPVDFERQTLTEELHASGHRSAVPTFVSWLGVTMYLTEAAIFETLRYVASFAPGSEIVFQYVLSDALLREESRKVFAMLKAFTAARGEPFVSAFDPAVLTTQVKALGFKQVWDVGPEEANARYFAGRTDGLRILPMFNLMRARV